MELSIYYFFKRNHSNRQQNSLTIFQINDIHDIHEGVDDGFMQNLKSISLINMMKRQLNHTWSQSLDKLHFEGLFGESADHIDKSVIN